MFKCLTSVALAGWLEVLAMESGRNVVFDQAEKKDGLESAGDSVLSVLEANGYRVLEQRFPRRAYVVIRDGDPPLQELQMVDWQGVLWDGIQLPVPTE